MRIRTWHVESFFVALVLGLSTLLLTQGRAQDWVATIAVWITFGHASVAHRLEEVQAKRATPEVHCRQWLTRYLVAKESCWILAFVWAGLYPPLVGTALFLLYPAWRRLYRAYFPLGRSM